MYSGIVQDKLIVKDIVRSKDFQSIFIEFTEELLVGLKLGASVSVNGVCLTVAEIDQRIVKFDIIDETLKHTNLGSLESGNLTNIERSLKYGDEIGGHPLSGHIDCTAEILNINQTENNYQITVSIPEQVKAFIFPKGYIGFNGASLTVNNLEDDSFTVNLIPETLKLTNLNQLTVGQKVNLEIDRQTQTIVTTVERVLAAKGIGS